MERTGADVDTFLAELEGEHGEAVRHLDAVIRRRLPDRERELWEGVFWGGTEQRIIGYARIEQPRPKGPAVEWFLIGLAAQQQHVSVYVNAAGEGGYLVKEWAARLGRVKVGAAAITVRRLADLDEAAFEGMLAQAAATLEP